MLRLDRALVIVCAGAVLTGCARTSQRGAALEAADAGAMPPVAVPAEDSSTRPDAADIALDAAMVPSFDAATTAGDADADRSSSLSADAAQSPAPNAVADASVASDAMPDAANQADTAVAMDAAANGCSTRELAGTDATQFGSTFSSIVFSAGSISGGELVFHNAGGWGSTDPGLTTLGTIRHKLLDNHEPLTEVYAATASSNCTPEVRTSAMIQIASEDDSLLAVSWTMTLRLLSAERIRFDYEGPIDTLSGSLREQLTSDSRTAALDRVRFSFEIPSPSWQPAMPGRAVLFNSQKPAQELPLFDWNPGCVSPTAPDALRCGDTANGLTPMPFPRRCVSTAIAASRPFEYTRSGVGKSIAHWTFGSLKPSLAGAGRKPFFEMESQSANFIQTTLQRCGAIGIAPSCDETTGAGCTTCDDPGPMFVFCNNYP